MIIRLGGFLFLSESPAIELLKRVFRPRTRGRGFLEHVNDGASLAT